MKPVKLSRTGRRSAGRRAHRPAGRTRLRFAVRLRSDLRYWDRRPRPIRWLLFLARRLLKFHEAEPLLAELSTEN